MVDHLQAMEDKFVSMEYSKCSMEYSKFVSMEQSMHYERGIVQDALNWLVHVGRYGRYMTCL